MPTESPSVATPKSNRVLIVDDDPVLRAIAREYLTIHGFEVDELEDGTDAARHVQRLNPVLVILDMFMPNKDGFETIREIRTTTPDAKILAISSGGRIGAEEVLHWAEVAGADATIPKPLVETDLLRAIAKILG